MESEIISKHSTLTKIDPTEFDLTICALLTGLGAEKYIDIFRKLNIGQSTLVELTDEDLTKLGIIEPEIRQKILDEVQNLPIYEETCAQLKRQICPNIGPIEIAEILEETSQHLYRIYLSVLANTLAIKKTKNIADCLLHDDKYASDIAITTWNEIVSILNTMDVDMHSKMKHLVSESEGIKYKKVFVGTVGSVAIAVLTVLFFNSLKNLK